MKPLPSPFSIATCAAPMGLINFGVSGQAAYELLLATGRRSEDIALLDATFQGSADSPLFRRPEDLLRAVKPATLVVSPGYPLATPWLQTFQATGGFITTELELAASLLQTERVIAVTGSVGKSTTVSLLEAGLRAFCPQYFVGGNLGIPLAKYAREVLRGERPRAEWVVLELSSYQLEGFRNLRAEISGLTSLTPNHLERYPDLDTYYKTKFDLLNYTERTFVLNDPGGDLRAFADRPEQRKALRESQREILWVSPRSSEVAELSLRDSRLLGRHNQENLAFAARIAQVAGWPSAAFAAMKQFGGLAHRLETLGHARDVLFINDSKSTTIASVLLAVDSALEKMAPHARLHLLLGGRDKNLPWQDLAPLAKNPQLRFHFFGECAKLAQSQSALPGDQRGSLRSALPSAFAECRAGDIFLLSPGGTSLDEFKNFEERGLFFRDFFLSVKGF